MQTLHLGRRPRIAVIGSGIAGMATALALAPVPVLLVTAGSLARGGSTWLAQGGIAAAIGDGDSALAHTRDTVQAGAGWTDEAVAHAITDAGADVIGFLQRHKVQFDMDGHGSPVLTLEAAHSHRRILHAGGDRTGAVIAAALAAAVRASDSIQLQEQTEAVDLRLADGQVSELELRHTRTGEHQLHPVDHVVLATGGIGGLYRATTNPAGNWGSGLVLAARAGAVLADLALVQFHPTALDRRPPAHTRTGGPGQSHRRINGHSDGDQAPGLSLISEAVRGEGGQLVDDRGQPIMDGIPGGDLAPRDIVARRIWSHRATGRPVFLDARTHIGKRFPKRFPGITRLCHAVGIDPVRDPIPVRPAAHYHMGGIRTDAKGRTSIPGLWAVGEAACTGLHGANRLASNSLLEGVAMALSAANAMQERAEAPVPANRPRADSRILTWRLDGAIMHPLTGDGELAVQDIMEQHAGVVRSGSGLRSALAALAVLRARYPDDHPTARQAEAAILIAAAAWQLQGSIGAHSREEFPDIPGTSQRHVTAADLNHLVATLSDPDRQWSIGRSGTDL